MEDAEDEPNEGSTFFATEADFNSSAPFKDDASFEFALTFETEFALVPLPSESVIQSESSLDAVEAM